MKSFIFSDAERIARATAERLRDGLGSLRAAGSGRASNSPPAPTPAIKEDPDTGDTSHQMLWGADVWGDPNARWNEF